MASETVRQKLIIVDDNPRFSAALLELFKASDLFEPIVLIGGGEEALEYFSCNEPSGIMVLDMIMPGIDGVELLHRLSVRDLLNNVVIIALSPLTNDAMMQLVQSIGVLSYYIAMPTPPEMIFNRVLDFAAGARQSGELTHGMRYINLKKSQAEGIVVKYLITLGIPAHFSGYAYLKTGIKYTVDNYGMNLGVTTHIYPEIARVHQSTPKRVERAIRNAIDTAWIKGDIEVQHKMFGYTVNDNKGKPTNKEFIAMVTDRAVMRIKRS